MPGMLASKQESPRENTLDEPTGTVMSTPSVGESTALVTGIQTSAGSPGKCSTPNACFDQYICCLAYSSLADNPINNVEFVSCNFSLKITGEPALYHQGDKVMPIRLTRHLLVVPQRKQASISQQQLRHREQHLLKMTRRRQKSLSFPKSCRQLMRQGRSRRNRQSLKRGTPANLGSSDVLH